MDKIAIVGAGLVGRAWALVFARAGMAVAMWDKDPDAIEAAEAFIAERLPELREAGLLADDPATVLARITRAATLEEALDGAVHVQESGPERVEAKRALFEQLDRLAPASVVLASSTSGIPASAFTKELRGRARCLVAHPVNPPYLIPLVELCPASWTASDTVLRTRALMTRAGQVPVTVNREVAGFVLNRLQIALVAEAFRLVADGVMTPEDVDCHREGRAGAPLVVHGAIRDDRPERARRPCRLLCPIWRVVRTGAARDDALRPDAGTGERCGCRRTPEAAAGKSACATGVAGPAADGAAGA